MQRDDYDNFDKILELLEEKNRTLNEVQLSIGEGKRITYNLCKLLKEKRIRIVGIDPNVENFAGKHLIFEKIIENSNNPNIIRDIIMNLGNPDKNIKIKYSNELQNLIEKKLNKIDSEKDAEWENLSNNVIIRKLNDHELARAMALQKLEILKEDKNNLEAYKNEFDLETDFEFLSMIYNEYLEDENLSNELNEEREKYTAGEINGDFKFIDPALDDFMVLRKNIADVTKEEMLSCMKIYNPAKMSPLRKQDLINKIIFFIEGNVYDLKLTEDDTYTHSCLNNIRELALGLSDLNDSLGIFKKFIKKVETRYSHMGTLS